MDAMTMHVMFSKVISNCLGILAFWLPPQHDPMPLSLVHTARPQSANSSLPSAVGMEWNGPTPSAPHGNSLFSPACEDIFNPSSWAKRSIRCKSASKTLESPNLLKGHSCNKNLKKKIKNLSHEHSLPPQHPYSRPSKKNRNQWVICCISMWDQNGKTQPQWPFPSDSELPKHWQRFTSETIWNDVRCLPQPPPNLYHLVTSFIHTLQPLLHLAVSSHNLFGRFTRTIKFQNFAQAFWVSTSSTSFWAGTFHAGIFVSLGQANWSIAAWQFLACQVAVASGSRLARDKSEFSTDFWRTWT